VTRVLLLGSGGFLGRHVRRELTSANGIEVTTAGRSPGCDAEVDLVRDGADGIRGLLARLGPDVVVNCAGRASGPPDQLAETNITGTANLVQALAANPGRFRLVHLGSAAEYGKVRPGVPVTEVTRPCPVDVYGVTKLAATSMIGAAVGLNSLVLRVFNPVGPGAPADSLPGRLAAELARAVAEGGDVGLGPLDSVRDFVDVRDVAHAVLLAAKSPAVRGVCNVASGRAVAARTLADMLSDIAGFSGALLEREPGPVRSAVVAWQQADISMTVDRLGWRPSRDLTTSLTDLWRTATCQTGSAD